MFVLQLLHGATAYTAVPLYMHAIVLLLCLICCAIIIVLFFLFFFCMLSATMHKYYSAVFTRMLVLPNNYVAATVDVASYSVVVVAVIFIALPQIC